jgi:glycosyltransferase involved in cell wall biosynthesis
MNVIYVTYDGVTDHIGQSQVAPYLVGLAAKGHKIFLVSAEKPEKSSLISEYKKIFENAGIEWHRVQYHKKPAVISTLWDLYKMNSVTRKLLVNKIDIIHCRSYIASLIGLSAKKRKGVKFIFDMRDFWADSGRETRRFDTENNLIHRLIYKFFKRKERQFLEQADHVISLTFEGKKVLDAWRRNGMKITQAVSVIPCCADFELFDSARLDKERLLKLRTSLGLDGCFVLNYLGSLGPTYLTNEMMDVFKVLLKKRPNSKFLIIANNDHHLAIKAAKEKEIDPQKLIIVKGTKEEIPYLVAQANLSVLFYHPSFGKKACSPVKLGELMAMNIPVIGNTQIGDLDSFLDLEKNNSTVVHSFDEDEYSHVLDKVLEKMGQGNSHIRNTARDWSLENGIDLYDKVYQSLQISDHVRSSALMTHVGDESGAL